MFRGCPNLIVLHLSSNRIKKINKNLFDNLILLEDLDLSGNNLIHLEKSTFKDLLSLKRLKLAENNIVDLDLGNLALSNKS